MTDSPCMTQSLSSLGLGTDGGFGGTPADFTAPPRAVHCTSVAKCGCSGTFKAMNPFIVKDKCAWIDQLDLAGRNKGAGTGGGTWDADVVLDGTAKQITVTHKIRFVNLMGDRGHGVRTTSQPH